MIRIISGDFRGKKIPVPVELGVRPTTDRVRTAMFNLLTARLGSDWSQIRVLDGFAGSGALGFEAMSRGAAHVTFCDANANVAKHLKSQARQLRRPFTVLHTNFLNGLKKSDGPYDLIFLDPPYHTTNYTEVLSKLVVTEACHANTLIVLEQPQKNSLEIPKEFAVLVERSYGKTLVCIFTLRDVKYA